MSYLSRTIASVSADYAKRRLNFYLNTYDNDFIGLVFRQVYDVLEVSQDFEIIGNARQSYFRGLDRMAGTLKDSFSLAEAEMEVIIAAVKKKASSSQKTTKADIILKWLRRTKRQMRLVYDIRRLIIGGGESIEYPLGVDIANRFSLATLTLSKTISGRCEYVDMKKKKLSLFERILEKNRTIAKQKKVEHMIKSALYQLDPDHKRTISESPIALEHLLKQIELHIGHDAYKIEETDNFEEAYAREFVHSCMTDNPKNCLDVYEREGNKVLLVKKKDSYIARAILWSNVKLLWVNEKTREYSTKEVMLVDRMYTSEPNSKELCYQKMIEYVEGKYDINCIRLRELHVEDLQLKMGYPEYIVPIAMFRYLPSLEYNGVYPYNDTFTNAAVVNSKHANSRVALFYYLFYRHLSSYDFPKTVLQMVDKDIDIDTLRNHTDFLKDVSLPEEINYIFNYGNGEAACNELCFDAGESIHFEDITSEYMGCCGECGSEIFERDEYFYYGDEIFCVDCGMYIESLDEYVPSHMTVYDEINNESILSEDAVSLDYCGFWTHIDETIYVETSDYEGSVAHQDVVYLDYWDVHINGYITEFTYNHKLNTHVPLSNMEADCKDILVGIPIDDEGNIYPLEELTYVEEIDAYIYKIDDLWKYTEEKEEKEAE